MFRTPTVIATALLVVGSLLGAQAKAEHLYDSVNLLPAACKLKDTTRAFEAVNCRRPMTSYTLHQVRALRISAEQFHEAVRCQAPPAQIAASFDRVCAYAARADARFQRSRNFRLDHEWSTAWECVQNDIAAIRCLLDPRRVVAARGCGTTFGYGAPHRGDPYQPAPGFRPPQHRQPPSRFDSRPEVLPPPPAHVPSAYPGRPIPGSRDARNEALQSLLLSLLR